MNMHEFVVEMQQQTQLIEAARRQREQELRDLAGQAGKGERGWLHLLLRRFAIRRPERIFTAQKKAHGRIEWAALRSAK